MFGFILGFIVGAVSTWFSMRFKSSLAVAKSKLEKKIEESLNG